jgi:hypothetical protein
MQAHDHPLFEDPSRPWGPPVTPELVARVEASLGLRLPAALVSDLTACNGGYLRRTRIDSSRRPVQIRDLAGVGYSDGLELSPALCREWDYPTPSLVLSAEGPTAILLDYRRCGPHGEPAVVFVDTDHEVGGRPVEWMLAPDWATFRARLRYGHARFRFAVLDVEFFEDILEKAERLGAVGGTRPDHDGGFTRSLTGWTSSDDGPALIRVLRPQRPDGSYRLPELGSSVFVVETNIREVERFVGAVTRHLPGRHLRLC